MKKSSIVDRLRKKVRDEIESSRCSYRRKTFFLTYSQTSLSKKDLEIKWPYPGIGRYVLKEMVLALEHHSDGNLHWHVFLNFKNRIQVSNMSFFDCFSTSSQKMEHPNVHKVWYIDGLMKYMNKEKYKVYEYGISLDAKNFARKKHMKYSKSLLSFCKDELSLYEFINLEPHLLLSAKKLIEGKNLYKSSKDSELIRYRNQVNTEKKRHFWIFGETNSGKTYYKENLLKKRHPNDWFDIPYNNDFFGYNGERFLFADEFDGQLSIWQLNLLCDGGAKMNVKGSSTVIYEYPIVYVFSNHRISEVYDKVAEKNPNLLQTLYSRFNEYYMTHFDIYDVSNGFSDEKRRCVYCHERDYDYDWAKCVYDDNKSTSLLSNAREWYFYNKFKDPNYDPDKKEEDVDINDLGDDEEEDEDGSQAIEDAEFDELDEDDY